MLRAQTTSRPSAPEGDLAGEIGAGVAASIASLKMGERRIEVSDKSLINCRADLNQLMPFKYQWAWERYLASSANHWMPSEISMADDIKEWKSDGLTESERRVCELSLGFFSTADSLVANNIVLAVYAHITNPECRQFLLRQAYEEALHTHAYQYCVESLGMDSGTIFNMYREVSSVNAKAEWALAHTRELCDPAFKTGTVASDRQFLRNLVAFYMVLEGIFFYGGFASVLSLGNRNLLKGTAQQFQYIMRDESNHIAFGLDMITRLIAENPHVWTEDMQTEVINMVREGLDLEKAFVDDMLSKGPVPLLAKKDLYEYLESIANRRLVQLGLEPQWPRAQNRFHWLQTMTDFSQMNNFFESRVTEYQTGVQLEWTDET